AVASGCDAIPSRRTGNRFRAVARSCPGSRVRVMARIFKRCGVLRGALRTRRRSRRFTAMRVRYNFVQPFDIVFRYEDRHVIAFFDGHPEYEAVEAFLAERTGQGPLIRAILTRHDKTQVDLLNDERVLKARRAANPSRAAYVAPVTFGVSFSETLPHTQLRFVSQREVIALDLRGTTPALPAFGGLTDPEGHAPDVLPILYRDASAVADPTASLTIDG